MKKPRLLLLDLHDARFARIIPDTKTYAEVHAEILREHQPVISPLLQDDITLHASI